ncbi:MAG: FAD-dependent oxidoreductase [Spirochaetales bacterium]|nr:FAD-dependent oxidoreductase [Spirochaetales bacterium]
MNKYDIVVIGAGSGGITSAVTAAGFGKKVLLVDKALPGGECTWSGCVPSKALIHEAKKAHTVRSAFDGYRADRKAVMDYVRSVRENIYAHETPEALAKSGIDFLQGKAVFKDSKTLLVDGAEVVGKKYIISTGSSPFVPAIKGIDSVPYLTNESLFNLEELPESMIVLGGGPIGIELAQAMNRLGVKVSLVEMLPVLAGREEKEFSLAIEKVMRDEGVNLLLGARAESVESMDSAGLEDSGKIIRLTCEQSGEKISVEGATLMVAIGRRANVEGLGLKEAGIAYSAKGIEVNKKLQTSRKNIYAVGDVAGPYLFSHMANVQGIQATQNAILPVKRRVSYENVAWVTFTEPEMARAGMTEEEARKKHGDSIRVYESDLTELDRGRTEDLKDGMIKVILNRKGKVLGVSILAERAGELIGEAQLLRTANLNFAKMASVIHPYPTYAEVFTKIGKRVLVDNLLNHPVVKLFRRSK